MLVWDRCSGAGDWHGPSLISCREVGEISQSWKAVSSLNTSADTEGFAKPALARLCSEVTWSCAAPAAKFD
jgi:hypothetical protein